MADTPKVQKKDGSTRFHRLAKRAGGISRDEAIKRSDAFLNSVKPKYLEWVAADIARLELALKGIPGESVLDVSAIEAAYHKARVVRDLGETMGYPLITVVANSLCELLHRFQKAEIYNPAAVDTHFWSLLLVSSTDYEKTSEAATKDLLMGLQKVVELFPPVDAPSQRPN